jgi:hypothetical protein
MWVVSRSSALHLPLHPVSRSLLRCRNRTVEVREPNDEGGIAELRPPIYRDTPFRARFCELAKVPLRFE